MSPKQGQGQVQSCVDDWSEGDAAGSDEDAGELGASMVNLHEEGKGDQSFEVVHVRESWNHAQGQSANAPEATEGEDETEDDAAEELLLEQRIELLASALKEARAALVGALGEKDFAELCTEVLRAADSEEEAFEWRPTSADPDGRYMLQVYHYIYLEEELMRCEARARALAGV